MRALGPYVLAVALLPACLAQQWQLGAAGGFGIAKNLTVSSGSGSATTGFKGGLAASAFAGHHLYSHLAGEFRYTYRFGDLKLSSGGTEYTFGGLMHAVHYDLQVYPSRRDAAVRPFIAGGGGVRLYRGTGTEHAFQPLSSFAILTKTSEVTGLVTAGGGVQIKVAPHLYLRIEVRDYITPVPKQVLTPGPRAKIGGWVHDFTPLGGISFGF